MKTQEISHHLRVYEWHAVCVCHCVSLDLSSSPPGPYGQEQYMFRPEERSKAPPILPPHLLQVILNKDTNISVSFFPFQSLSLSQLFIYICFIGMM